MATLNFRADGDVKGKTPYMMLIGIALVVGAIIGVVAGVLIKKSNKYKNTRRAYIVMWGILIGVLSAVATYFIAKAVM